MSKVSIIIPLFNSEDYISDCIESVLNQTHKKIEIIIIDDGSTDNSYQIAQKLAKKSSLIKLLKQINSGASTARNAGLSIAQGDYIQYLDADDILAPDKIENQVATLKSHSEMTISSCRWGRFINNISETNFVFEEIWKDYSPIDWLIDSWKGKGMMQTSCWLIPRKLSDTAGQWNEKITLNDDGEYFARVLMNCDYIKYCNDAIVYYRKVYNSLSRRKSYEAAKSFLNSIGTYEKILAYIDNYDIKRTLARIYSDFIYQFHPYYEDLLTEARQKIKKLGFNKPISTGGKAFKMMASIIGFENALNLRNKIK